MNAANDKAKCQRIRGDESIKIRTRSPPTRGSPTKMYLPLVGRSGAVGVLLDLTTLGLPDTLRHLV
jgi:hypothetical protein